MQILVVLVAGLGGACDLVRSPTVELTGVRVRGIGLRGATLLAELSIDNPNKFAIETDSVTFLFEARDPRSRGWSEVTSGTNPERVRIEETTRTTVEIPIDFAYSNLGTPIRAIIDRGTLDYRVSGRVFVRKPLRKSVPFRREGTVSIGGN